MGSPMVLKLELLLEFWCVVDILRSCSSCRVLEMSFSSLLDAGSLGQRFLWMLHWFPEPFSSD